MTEQDSYENQSGIEPREGQLYTGDVGGSGHSMIELLTQLALRKWLIAKVTGVSMLIGLILCFALPVRYTAITLLMPPKQTESTASLMASEMLGGAFSAAAESGLLKDPNAIYIGLLKSRPIADAIIGKFGLLKAYRSKDMTNARQMLEKRTEIVSEKSSLISISVTDGDKKRAADMANAYAEQLRILTKSVAVTEASRRRLFYEDQLKSQKETLIAAEVAFQQVQQSKGLVVLSAQAQAIIGSLADLRAQIAVKQVELQAMRSYSTEHNPDVQLAERELSTLQGEAARMNQNSQPTSYSDMGLKAIPKAGLDYIRAERELQYQQTIFDLLLKQLEAAKLDEAKDAISIQVVAPAIAPDRKSTPKRAAIMLLSTMLGLFLGVVIVRVQHKIEDEFSDPEGANALRKLKSALTGQKVKEAAPDGNL